MGSHFSPTTEIPDLGSSSCLVFDVKRASAKLDGNGRKEGIVAAVSLVGLPAFYIS